MGLQNQLNDVSSGSIPLLLLAQIAIYFNQLRSFLLTLFQSLGLSRFRSDHDGFFSAVGSGLAGLIILSDQMYINNHFFYTYSTAASDGHNGNNDCVFCQNTFYDGDQVRMLPCRHVFHSRCFDGWLRHLKFSCPLCRFPLVSEERVALTEARLGRELVSSWFSMR